MNSGKPIPSQGSKDTSGDEEGSRARLVPYFPILHLQTFIAFLNILFLFCCLFVVSERIPGKQIQLVGKQRISRQVCNLRKSVLVTQALEKNLHSVYDRGWIHFLKRF